MLLVHSDDSPLQLVIRPLPIMKHLRTLATERQAASTQTYKVISVCPRELRVTNRKQQAYEANGKPNLRILTAYNGKHLEKQADSIDIYSKFSR